MVSTEELDAASRHVLLAGGGSAGHVFPALALAAALRDRGWAVSLVGRSGQMEERLARREGVAFLALPASPLVGASLMQKARTLWTTLHAALAGRGLVRRAGAGVVVGMGGYVSVPAVLGARLAGRPTLLFEPNAVAGVANRWLSRWAAEAAVAYRAAAGSLACEVVETGTPVRAEFFRQTESSAGEAPRLLILGGSQGARQLNELVPASLATVEDSLAGLKVTHQAGAGNVEATRAAYESAGITRMEIEVVDFLDDMAGAIGASQLVISRAGAVTLAELCAVGRSVLLVPLELAGGHQRDNAAALVEAGTAEMLPTGANAADLGGRLRRLFSDVKRLEEMGRAARGLSRPAAAERLADRVVALGGDR